MTPGPPSLWPKVKHFLNVMSRFLKNIKSGWGRNMNLSQYLTLRYLNNVLYISFVLPTVKEVEDVLDSKRHGDYIGGTVLTNFHRMWKKLSLRCFVEIINSIVRDEG